MRQLGAIVARLAPGKMRKRPDAADHASPAPSVRRATSAFLSRSGIWAGAVLFVSLAFAGAAQAACDVNTASTSGVTANFTSIGQTIGICVSDNKVLYGLYSNQNVSANYNAPISNNAAAPNAGPFPYANYFATTAKATYLFVPIRGTAEAGAQEYDVTLQSVTGSGADQVTLYYSSFCQDAGRNPRCQGGPTVNDPGPVSAGPADTPFAFTLNLPTAAPTIAAAFSPTSITTAQTSTLTLTLTNPNTSTALSGVAVAAAALPANLAGASPATTCGGTATYGGGAGGNLSLSGASLAASATCTVTLTVSSTVASSYSYTTGVVSSTTPATTGTAATTPTALTVTAPVTATQVIASRMLTANQAATPFTPVTGSGGTSPLSYSVAPALPAGLTLAAATGRSPARRQWRVRRRPIR